MVPAVSTAGCGGRASLALNEPDAVERSAVAAAILEELSLEGALLDDIPLEQALSIAPSASLPLPRPLAKLLRAWSAPVPTSCWTVESSADADEDGIPTAASILFGCSSSTYDVSGTGIVLDDSDESATSGFAVGLGDLRVTERLVPGADPRSHTIDGSFLVYVRPDPSPGAVDAKIDVGVAVTGVADNAALSDVSFHSTGLTTYYPDADLGPTTRSRRGSVTSSVKTTLTERGVARTWTRQGAPALHWNLSCKTVSSSMPGFDGGSVVYTDDRGNVLRIDFTSCTTWTVTLNGAGY